jgi:hypothetical protein
MLFNIIIYIVVRKKLYENILLYLKLNLYYNVYVYILFTFNLMALNVRTA